MCRSWVVVCFMKFFLESCQIMHLYLIQVFFLWIFLRTLDRFNAAVFIASAGVTVGLKRYLCLKNTFVLIIVDLVSFDHTLQHM